MSVQGADKANLSTDVEAKVTNEDSVEIALPWSGELTLLEISILIVLQSESDKDGPGFRGYIYR